MIQDQSLGPIELPIKGSPSAFNNFDACRRKFYYSRKLRRIEGEEPIFFTRGTEAHQVMEGKKALDEISKEAQTMAKKLIKIRDGLEYTVTHHEVTQKWNITDAIFYERRIDALGYDKNGMACIIDWKTASASWDVIGTVAPKSLTWQTPGYLYNPPEHMIEELGIEVWPKQMVYIVGPMRGRGQVFDLQRSDPIIKELGQEFSKLLVDIEEAVEENEFPRSPGFGCKWCPFAELCFNQDGWQDLYDHR
jgi:CRISPR/Cas system-associated exonuclease Cas4 (RecB family)